MKEIVRFGVSLEKELLHKFDSLIGEKKYPNRSEAIRDLIRENLVKREWIKGEKVAGVITLVYDHHKRELVNTLTETQHHFHELIISTQHIHLDEDRCLEVVVVKGKPKNIEELANRLKATKGVKHSSLIMTTIGKQI